MSMSSKYVPPFCTACPTEPTANLVSTYSKKLCGSTRMVPAEGENGLAGSP